MRRLFYRVLVMIMIATAAVTFYNCNTRSYSQTGEGKDKDTGMPVEVTKVVKGDITANYSGSATLEAEAEAVVVAKIGGVVKEIFTEEGKQVKQGQALAKLEDDEFKLELTKAESMLKKLSNEFQRNEALYKNKIISKDTFDQVKYDHLTQESMVELARLNYKYTTIRAPFSGVVVERLIKKGNMVQKNQATFRITDSNPLLALLHVPEKEMSKLNVGFPAKLYADAIPGAEFQGKVIRISPVVDAGTGTCKVTVEVKNNKTNDPKLKPGMFTRVHIVHDTHKAVLLVPKDAILSEDADSWVFKVKKENTDSLATKTKVTIGYINKTHVEILSGLQEGDTIVTTGLSTLKDGTKVKVI